MLDCLLCFGFCSIRSALPQHFLYFFPPPTRQVAFRPILAITDLILVTRRTSYLYCPSDIPC